MKLKRENVNEKFRDILIKHLFCGELTEDVVITEETNLVEDLAADSLDLIEILMAAEDAFEIDCEIPNSEVSDLNTVGEILDFIIKTHEEQTRITAPDPDAPFLKTMSEIFGSGNNHSKCPCCEKGIPKQTTYYIPLKDQDFNDLDGFMVVKEGSALYDALVHEGEGKLPLHVRIVNNG